MKLVLLIAAIVLCIIAAFLGWNFSPHHSFSFLSVGIACIAASFIVPKTIP
jgi:phosphate/sulfate permease